ncbi:hypothetical protein [Actinomadura napierensis]|uniref:hypothetical protein n=1 Tax=Actinomadura napierensis TaxID=267854 RepID=UPI0031D4842F
MTHVGSAVVSVKVDQVGVHLAVGAEASGQQPPSVRGDPDRFEHHSRRRLEAALGLLGEILDEDVLDGGVAVVGGVDEEAAVGVERRPRQHALAVAPRTDLGRVFVVEPDAVQPVLLIAFTVGGEHQALAVRSPRDLPDGLIGQAGQLLRLTAGDRDGPQVEVSAGVAGVGHRGRVRRQREGRLEALPGHEVTVAGHCDLSRG